MWILETIIIIVLIANDFSFWQIMLIMLIFTPLFYWIMLPLIMFLFSGDLFKKEEKSKVDNIIEYKSDKKN